MKERLVKILESWGFKRHGSFYVKEGATCYIWVDICGDGTYLDVKVDLSLKMVSGCYLNGGNGRGFIVYDYMLDDEYSDLLCSLFKRSIVEMFTCIGWDIADVMICKEVSHVE